MSQGTLHSILGVLTGVIFFMSLTRNGLLLSIHNRVRVALHSLSVLSPMPWKWMHINSHKKAIHSEQYALASALMDCFFLYSLDADPDFLC